MKRVIINGQAALLEPDNGALLEQLRAHGQKSVVRGCQTKTCGSCRVLVNGAIVHSCAVSAGELPHDAAIHTQEGVEQHPKVKRALDFFNADRPTRCRMCVGGLAVTAAALAESEANRNLTIDHAIGAATCMCTGRGSWRRALTKS